MPSPTPTVLASTPGLDSARVKEVSKFFDLSTNPYERRKQFLMLSTVFISGWEDDTPSASSSPTPCTGVHLGHGLVLTAAHCFERRAEGTNTFIGYNKALRVVFGPQFPDALAPTAGHPAEIEYDGRTVTLTSETSPAYSDFLIVRTVVPNEFLNAYVDLAQNDPWYLDEDDVKLEAYVYWKSSGTMQRSQDDYCVALLDHCRRNPIAERHQCDADLGSSGAPLFRLGSGGVVAVHLAGDEGGAPKGAKETTFNCALPSSKILGWLARARIDKISGLLNEIVVE